VFAFHTGFVFYSVVYKYIKLIIFYIFYNLFLILIYQKNLNI
jgi:hypothetical protein